MAGKAECENRLIDPSGSVARVRSTTLALSAQTPQPVTTTVMLPSQCFQANMQFCPTHSFNLLGHPTGGFATYDCSVRDPLPPAATLRSLQLRWQAGIGVTYAPEVRFFLNGTLGLGSSFVTAGQCGNASYQISSPDYPFGITGYVYGAVNSFRINVYDMMQFTTGDSIARGFEVVYTWDPPPPLTFTVTDANTSETSRRVYASVSADDGNVSTNQTAAKTYRMGIYARTGTGAAMQSTKVYLHIEDPPSTAPYESDRHINDNKGPSVGELVGPTVVRTAKGPAFYEVTTDSNGYAEFSIKTGSVGGDNYRVAAEFDPTQDCLQRCTYSGTVTVWKRTYVELDRQYVFGTPIFADVPGGSNQVRIIKPDDDARFSSTKFKAGAQIRLMHAPYADMSGPRQTNSSGGSLLNLSTWSETATIKKVSKDTTANPLGVIDNSTGYLLLIDTNPATNANEGVAYPYYTDKVGTAATDSSLNDGVEIILTSGGEYDAKTDLVPDLFRGAFVDLVVNGAGRNPQPTVPHTSKLDGSALPATRATQYGSKWSDSESRSPNLRQRRANYQHVIIGSRTSESEEMGLTENEAEGWNESFVARFTIDKRIDEANSLTSIPPGTDKYKFSEEIVAHELTHQWFTNLNNPGRHCFGKFTYSNSTEWCLMAFSGSGGPGTGNLFPDAQRTNLFMALHYVPGNDAIPADSEYITIRAAADPLQ